LTNYLFLAPDEFLLGKRLSRLKQAIGDPEMASLNIAELDGARSDASDILYHAGALPFLADRRLIIVRAAARIAGGHPPHDARFVAVPAPGEGAAEGRSGGAAFLARWSTRGPVGGEGLSIPALRFPILFRSWRPGDRIRLAAGTRKLKKVFGEARVPRPARARRPVLADAGGRILWVPGVARSVDARPVPQDAILYVGVDLDDATD